MAVVASTSLSQRLRTLKAPPPKGDGMNGLRAAREKRVFSDNGITADIMTTWP